MFEIAITILLVLILSAIGLIFYILIVHKSSTPPPTSVIQPNIISITHEKDLKSRLEIEIKAQLLADQVKLQEQEQVLHGQILELKESLTKREITLEHKAHILEEEKIKIYELKEELRSIKSSLIEKKEELQGLGAHQKKEFLQKLETLSNYSQQEAKSTLLKLSQEEIGSDLLQWQQKYLEKTQDEAHEKAREIISMALQRCSSEVANEFTVTTIKLKNEDEKGKIIGKSGRNIQWLEKTLGVELIIDDTPEIITVSGFSSIRRHIAKRTIELLLEDGRIHPASIEEKHEKAKAEIAQDIADAGQATVNELGIIDFPAKLTRLIGRLKFRTSYGQNMLKHSVEMARLAALIANDINSAFPSRNSFINVDICIRGALLHDIGKGVDEDIKPKTSHIVLGERICDTFELDWRIKKCISSHHDESYYDSEHGFCIEAAIVDACDNLSGGRIGARKETAEAYYQRMEDLEKITETTPGVTKSWIMRGNRELWLFFDTAQVSASQMHSIVKDVARKIESNGGYPGETKVIGFWEDKIIEYAR